MTPDGDGNGHDRCDHLSLARLAMCRGLTGRMGLQINETADRSRPFRVVRAMVDRNIGGGYVPRMLPGLSSLFERMIVAA
jgi:hypothetical protein